MRQLKISKKSARKTSMLDVEEEEEEAETEAEEEGFGVWPSSESSDRAGEEKLSLG